MIWLLSALFGQALIAISAIFDKVLLKRAVPRPLQYAFGVGILAFLPLFLAPFGFQLPSLIATVMAFVAGAAFFWALYFGFKALKNAEAIEALSAISGFSPIFTLIFSFFILGVDLSTGELVAFGLLAVGSAIFSWRFIGTALTASGLFGLSNALHKSVFLQTNFITGLVAVQAGVFLSAISLLLFPKIRQALITKSVEKPKNIILYLLNRAASAGGAFLVTMALFLGHPALVDASSSFRFLIIFAAALLILKASFHGRILKEKIAATTLVVIGIIVLVVASYLKSIPIAAEQDIQWGVTFSARFSRNLDLDWKENYLALLDDLKIKNLRLVAYWDEIEPEDDKFNFTDLDWQMNEAAKRDAKVILAIGQKVPRWPECFKPEWIKNNELGTRNQELLEYLKTLVDRYKNHPTLEVWQVENEPYFMFGECGEFDPRLFKNEVSLVKSLDLTHPVMVTESGEFGSWNRALKYGDLLGITLYRYVYNDTFGQITQLFPAWYYRLKTLLAHPYAVVELQAEPWGPKLLPDLSLNKQLKLFDLQRLRSNLNFARKTGFDKFYLWGAEWWYFMKEKGYPEYWETVKAVF